MKRISLVGALSLVATAVLTVPGPTQNANVFGPGYAQPAKSYQVIQVGSRYPDLYSGDNYVDWWGRLLRGRPDRARFERRLLYSFLLGGYGVGSTTRVRFISTPSTVFLNGTALPAGFVLVNLTSSTTSSTSTTTTPQPTTEATTRIPRYIYAILSALPVDYPTY